MGSALTETLEMLEKLYETYQFTTGFQIYPTLDCLSLKHILILSLPIFFCCTQAVYKYDKKEKKKTK